MVTEVNVEIVTQIIESIFVTMMDLEVSATETVRVPAGDRVTSSVYIEGDWNGAVSMECNREQACLFAGRFSRWIRPRQWTTMCATRSVNSLT